MRNALALLIMIAIGLSSCGPQKDFKVTGTVAGLDSGMIFLQKRQEGEWVKLDSFSFTKGTFSFAGSAEIPEIRYLMVKDQRFLVPFFIENADITVTIYPDSADKSVVTGSSTQDIYNKFKEGMEVIDQEKQLIGMQYNEAEKAGDTAGMILQDSLYIKAEAKEKDLILSFAREHGNSVVGPYLIMRNAYLFELPELETAAASFDTSLSGTPDMQAILTRIDILKKVQIGQPAPDFTMNDSLGNPVALSSLKGKILLVDFWASWCGPCRGENPNLVKAYEKYKGKGFDVLGVSFDTDRAKWIRATKDDGLKWSHVSDLVGWKNAAGKIYGINSIPANVLLDKDQVIIARNLRGEELQAKLEEIFGPVRN